MVRGKQILASIALCLLLTLSYTPPVMATQASSTNWSVSEVNFGSGGSLESCSGSYCAKQSAGELTVGDTSSANYRAQGGFNTNREPYLELIASATPIDLGILDIVQTRYGSTTFSVKAHLAAGYDVYIDGTSLKNKTNGHVLATMATGGASAIGIEQFGINLRKNTTPPVGTDVSHDPDTTFSFGTPSAGYNTPDSFRFVAGERIAESSSSSSYTQYTMSVIANVGTTSPGGVYGGRLVLNVVPTF